MEDWYNEFIDAKYKHKANDINVLFSFECMKGITTKDAIGRIASESSSGTWTTLTNTPRLLPKTKAYAYWQSKNLVKIAYPRLIFEDGSVPAMMSGFGGNIFGMKAVENLRLLDATLPQDYVRTFRGPKYGPDVIRRVFKRMSGPITAVVPKPKLGYTSQEHAMKVGLAVYRGGIDCLKDDENLTDQKFNRFEERVKWVAKARDMAERETGDVKEAFLNVTAPDLKTLEKRVKFVHGHGFRYFMLDIVTSGFTAMQTAVELAHDYDMAIHGHRAMHAAFTKNPRHGISMLYLAKLSRLIGIDQLHIGTVIGKLAGGKSEVVAMKEMIMEKHVGEIKGLRMPQSWGSTKPMLPVSSGGLHPGLVPEVLDIYGTTDIVLQLGGGTQGHPMGIEAGAKATVQAIEAYKQGISLEEYAKTHKELASSLRKWGHGKPI
ncbi:type III ribulose-bisphosphate carboxylase [Candidatus Parvarchaeota archaeon]|nr:type III ribulose-bisphosphate carboxylase [Candidatus Parvarchaeota archaeon]